MDSEPRLSILFVLESPLEHANSLAFLNSYIDLIVNSLSDELEITLFYPEFSDFEEHYSLNIVQCQKYKKMVTYLPLRYEFFKETFANRGMEDVFRYILKEKHFDCIHIWSFKNHSFNYPFIAKERSIPVVVSICDGFLFSTSIFEKGVPSNLEQESVRISNFVCTPVSALFNKINKLVKRKEKSSFWFENIGRYTRYYNRTSLSPVESSVYEERASLCEGVIRLADKLHFFSELEYNLFYRSFVPEQKSVFIEQNIENNLSFANRPFEIEGAVKFGFVGEILPEEGILELVEAFNLLYQDGYQNELHIYGELHKNHRYFSRLRKKVLNPNLYFHGQIEPKRLISALNTFDVLVIPSKWHRSDFFLLNTAISLRKAIITTNRNCISEKVKKLNRGIILEQVNKKNIAETVSELERNRKKLYYLMRTTDDFINLGVEEDACAFIDIYNSCSKKPKDVDKILLKRKLIKKKMERQRG
ncbi:MAG: glycosyltransferase [bacterium]